MTVSGAFATEMQVQTVPFGLPWEGGCREAEVPKWDF